MQKIKITDTHPESLFYQKICGKGPLTVYGFYCDHNNGVEYFKVWSSIHYEWISIPINICEPYEIK